MSHRARMIQALYGDAVQRKPFQIADLQLNINIRWAVRGALLALLFVELVFIFFFNKFVTIQQEIFAQGSRIEVEYQRRDNLIPRLSEITRNYAQHERELMAYISDARALKQSSLKLKNMINPAKSAEAEKVFAKLVALAEHYPDLKAERSYQSLMTKIITTENRVAQAQEEYSALINEYNRTVQSFPYTMFARMLKFKTTQVYVPQKNPMPEKDKRFFFIY